MAGNVCKVILIGNLTRDPELRTTPKGSSVCQFGMAMNRRWRTQDGGEGEETCFVDVEAWGRQGEVVAQYCTKGRPLYVEGRLRLDQWDDKNSGQKRSRLTVVLEQFQFLGGREDGEGGGAASPPRASAPPARPAPAAPARPAPRPAPKDDLEEDVPF